MRNQLDDYWNTIYKKYHSYIKKNDNYIYFDIYKIYLYHTIYIICIKDLNRNDFTLLEVGSGTGLGLKYLNEQFNIKCKGVESNYKGAIFSKFVTNNKIKIINKDILKYKSKIKYDVVLSIGLLEHYKIGNLKSIINAHLIFSKKYVILLIPNTNQDSLYSNFLIDKYARYNTTYPVEDNCSYKQIIAEISKIPKLNVKEDSILLYSSSINYKKYIKNIFKKNHTEIEYIIKNISPNLFNKMFDYESKVNYNTRNKYSFFKMIILEKSN